MERRLSFTPTQAKIIKTILGRFADNEGDKIKMSDDSSMGSFLITQAEKIIEDIDITIEMTGGYWPKDTGHIGVVDVDDFPLELVVNLYSQDGEEESLKELLFPHVINAARNALLTAANRYESLVGEDDADLMKEEEEISRALMLTARIQ